MKGHEKRARRRALDKKKMQDKSYTVTDKDGRTRIVTIPRRNRYPFEKETGTELRT